ncbi:MAG: hypothetical protein HYU39_04405 [Thaumarchaeota archaeon]|nr:hypothetical protein [Nitrososphaerota archaeon]
MLTPHAHYAIKTVRTKINHPFPASPCKPMFSDEASRATKNYEEKFLNHPFLIQLSKGRLPKKNFTYYMLQDNLFLKDILLARRLLNAKHKSQKAKQVTRLLDSAYRHEAKGRNDLITKQLKLKEKHVEIAPTTLAYGSYLIRLASTASFEENLAALTPCAKLYSLIGERYAQCPASTHPLYGKWLAIYAATPMKKLTDQLTTILDSVAEKTSPRRQAMMQSYLMACRFETKFLDMAYHLEKWS